LINLSYLYRLEKMLPRNMDRDEILTWWAVMDAHDYPEAPSLYRKLFLNTTVNKPVAAQFELNATGDELLNPGTVIDLQDINPDPDLLAVVLGATRLKAKDLQLLVEAELPGGVITLNMAQLSFLFRVSSFCRAFKLSMSDYLSLKNIISVAPLASHDLDPPVGPADTLRFTEMHKVIERAGFSPEELDYLLRHRYEPKAPFAIAEEEKETLLKDLQAEVNRQLKEAYPAGITAREKVETKLVQV